MVNEANTPASEIERFGSTHQHDKEISKRIDEAVSRSNRPVSDILDSFTVYVRRIHLTRFLMHYEIYRKIADVPGSIAEIGVYRGAGLLTWAKLLEIYHPGDRLRKVIGFDNFAGFVDMAPEDGPEEAHVSKVIGGWSAAPYKTELEDHIDIFQDDSFIPRAKRVELVEGDIRETAKDYVERHPGLRLSLLHLDIDLYEPTLAALEALYPCLVQGGVVLIDQYGMSEWPGESKAVEDYFKDARPVIKKMPHSSLPGGYFVKE